MVFAIVFQGGWKGSRHQISFHCATFTESGLEAVVRLMHHAAHLLAGPGVGSKFSCT